jgi:hypothetical protein
MGCLNWRESRAEGRAEQKSSDLIPVQARDWLSRKRTPVRPPVSPVPAKLIFEEGTLEGRLDPHVQFQSPMETRSKIRVFDMVNSPGKLHKFTCVLKVKYLRQKKHADWISRMSAAIVCTLRDHISKIDSLAKHVSSDRGFWRRYSKSCM